MSEPLTVAERADIEAWLTFHENHSPHVMDSDTATEIVRRLLALVAVTPESRGLDLVEAMQAAGWEHGFYGDRCPNEWKCRESRPAYRLAPGALRDDLAAHYRVEAWTTKTPTVAKLPSWAAEDPAYAPQPTAKP